LAPELSFLCSLQNLGFNFFHANSYKKQKHEDLPTVLNKNGHNWQAHMLHDLGVEPSNLQHSVNVIQRQRVKEQLI
jgi:hypothetical protein